MKRAITISIVLLSLAGTLVFGPNLWRRYTARQARIVQAKMTWEQAQALRNPSLDALAMVDTLNRHREKIVSYLKIPPKAIKEIQTHLEMLYAAHLFDQGQITEAMENCQANGFAPDKVIDCCRLVEKAALLYSLDQRIETVASQADSSNEQLQTLINLTAMRYALAENQPDWTVYAGTIPLGARYRRLVSDRVWRIARQDAQIGE